MLSNAVQNQRAGIAECRRVVAALRARDEAIALQNPAALADAEAATRVGLRQS